MTNLFISIASILGIAAILYLLMVLTFGLAADVAHGAARDKADDR